MAAFNYIALDKLGKRQKGILEADNARNARQQLREKFLTPLSIHHTSEKTPTTTKKWNVSFSTRKKVRIEDLALFTRQMATLLNAGIPLDEVLTAVANQTEKPSVKSVLLGVRAKVMEGHSLAAGMNEFPQVFSRLYRTTVAAGERSGKLGQILIRLSEYTEKQQHIRRKIRQALIYPSLMTLVSIAVVVFLLIYIVPKIMDVFNQTEQALPLATLVLLSATHALQRFGLYFLGGLAISGYFFKRALKRETFKEKVDRFILRIPLIGKSVKTINSARFARTFGILNAASVPVLEAMHAASQLITPLPMRKALFIAIEQVREGSNIHLALQKTGYFSPMFVHLVASGESSGQLEKMLEKAAENQEADVETVIEGALTLFEPLMILVMGGVVLFIVLAIMLPIFAMDSISS